MSRKKLLQVIKGRPELVERLLAVAEPPAEKPFFSCPEDVVPYLRPHVVGRATECLVAVALNRRRKVIQAEILTTGTDGFTIVCPKQIYRWALVQGRTGASAIILAHNHPSGDPSPSPQDIEVTRRVAGAGRILGLPLLDHLIITDDRWQSLAALGYVVAN